MKSKRLAFLSSIAVTLVIIFGLPLAASATCTPSERVKSTFLPLATALMLFAKGSKMGSGL